MLTERVRVSEEGAVPGREGGDGFDDTLIVDRGPRGDGEFLPELLFRAESLEIRGC